MKFRILILPLILLLCPSLSSASDDRELPTWIDIAWHRGPDLPQAFQDSDGGILNDMLITTCGYCDSGATGPAEKKSKAPTGHHRKTWGLALNDASKGWDVFPDYPGDARQELCGVVVGSELFTWGGFSYAPPFAYRDGYGLMTKDGQWQWRPLPQLPWPICSMSCAAIGGTIYIFGGADFQLPQNKYLTNADRTGKMARVGARLLAIDTAKMNRGFRQCASCPGTPRMVAAMASVKGKLYLIGGATGQDNPTGSYCTVVDNWKYDPAADTWSRLTDTPIATGNFPAGAIVYEDRYILLIGGFQYANVMGPDGKTRKSFGKVTKHYPQKDYCSDILVFDTASNSFGRATQLPLNNNMPMAVLRGDILHLIGGETGGATIDGEAYGHHPDLYLIGKLSLASITH